jgi:hypothetical protein
VLASAGLAKEVQGRGADGGSGCAVEVLLQGVDCGRSGFYCDYAGKGGCELAGEEADAGEEIPGKFAALAFGYALD